MSEDIAKPSLKLLARHAFRFTWLTFAMACGIAVLLAVEAFVLWRLGIDYVPKTGVATAGVWDFAINDTGRWAVSRIVYMRKSRDESLQNEIVLHDMRHPEHPIRLGTVSYPRQLVISAQSDRFAVGCYDGSILTGQARPQAAPLQRLTGLEYGVNYELACSPDGQFLAAADPESIFIWQSSSGELLRRTPHPSGAVESLRFADDSQSLLLVSNKGQVSLWQVSTGELQHAHDLHASIEQSAWSMDGSWVALVLDGREAEMRLLNLETGALRTLDSRIARPVEGPIAVSRDGTRLATVHYSVNQGNCIEVWDSHSGERIDRFQGGEGNVNGLLFAADDTLYVWDSKGEIAAWSPRERHPNWNFCALPWARKVLLTDQTASGDELVPPAASL